MPLNRQPYPSISFHLLRNLDTGIRTKERRESPVYAECRMLYPTIWEDQFVEVGISRYYLIDVGRRSTMGQ